MMRFGFSLPTPGYGVGTKWCQQVVDKALDWEADGGLLEILQSMLVIDAGQRPLAATCFQETGRLIAATAARPVTPTQASFAAATQRVSSQHSSVYKVSDLFCSI